MLKVCAIAETRVGDGIGYLAFVSRFDSIAFLPSCLAFPKTTQITEAEQKADDDTRNEACCK